MIENSSSSSAAAAFFEVKCNTCKALFSCIEKVKEHYRGDWHILNSKRRANGLVPLSKEEYKKALPLIQKKQTSKPILLAKLNPEILSTSKVQLQSHIDENSSKNEEGDSSDDEVEDVVPDKEYLEPTASIFDQKIFPTVDECVEYMGLTYGFFIPDIEYLVDLNGFLSYLNEKVKIGHICLYCHKQLKQYRSCQHHMISKSHCKVAYQEDMDMNEFEDFYDFSESYHDDGINIEYDEDGNIIEKSLEISSLGELILADGRTLGHRAFRRYYKQRFSPEEARDSVLALQREELLRLGALQYGGQRVKMDELLKLSDTQVMSLLIQRQKEIRYHQMIEQRSKQKRDFIDQRREYKSTVDKLRSSATTTAKIRDYHSRLV